jgi:acyl-CoA hydrolase
MTETFESRIRVRMSMHDAHYGGNLVEGAHVMRLFGDIATELAILHDGDEGLLVGYEKIEFLAPVHGGDFIEAYGRIVAVGRTSRKIEFTAQKVIGMTAVDGQPSAADRLPTPVVVCRAVGTTVVPLASQRRRG